VCVSVCSVDDGDRRHRNARVDQGVLEMEFTVPERALIYQALREAASACRVEVRKKAYFDLARKMRLDREQSEVTEGLERTKGE
jgi:hypothetical protein